MEISAYMSALRSQGFSPSTAMSRPSIVSGDMLDQLSNMSASFEKAFKNMGKIGGDGTSSQPLDWTSINGEVGKQGVLPGPARLSPVPSYIDGRPGGITSGASEGQVIQAALSFHKNIMSVTATTTTIDLTSTVSKRSTQNIDTLIRGQ